jgi:hypothetical protein
MGAFQECPESLLKRPSLVIFEHRKGRLMRKAPFSSSYLAKIFWVNLLSHTNHLFLIRQVDGFALICNKVHNGEENT